MCNGCKLDRYCSEICQKQVRSMKLTGGIGKVVSSIRVPAGLADSSPSPRPSTSNPQMWESHRVFCKAVRAWVKTLLEREDAEETHDSDATAVDSGWEGSSDEESGSESGWESPGWLV